jgi:ABC-type bacteriocin/lantibiotic exporter with double-glycine peptidase domain
MGNSNSTIKDVGCLITDLSGLSSWYGKHLRPDELARTLKFTDTGLLFWNSIDAVLPFKFVYRYYKRDDAMIKKILFSKNDAVILEVQWGKGKHWVTAINWTKKNGYRVADPWEGKYIDLDKSQFPTITGFAVMTRK